MRMGQVYQATDTTLNRQVALKILLSAACVLMSSCQERLPAGPSDPATGVVCVGSNDCGPIEVVR